MVLVVDAHPTRPVASCAVTPGHVPAPADASQVGPWNDYSANDSRRRCAISAESESGDIFVDRAEAARRLCLSITELDDQRRAGNILAKRKGRKVLISVSELERFAASLPWDEPKR
jgi:hypothetical protein